MIQISVAKGIAKTEQKERALWSLAHLHAQITELDAVNMVSRATSVWVRKRAQCEIQELRMSLEASRHEIATLSTECQLLRAKVRATNQQGSSFSLF